MDMHSNLSHESGRLEQIVTQFLLKSLHVILDSRIPSLCSHDNSNHLSSAPRVRKSDKWFNLVLGDRPEALDKLNLWLRSLTDPLIIDIILVHREPSSSFGDDLYSASAAGSSVETVIERWKVQYKSQHSVASPPGESVPSYKKIYKKSIIFLRTLYSQMRLLPAYRIFRQLSTSSQTYEFDITYKISSSDSLSCTEKQMMKDHCFSPVEAHNGLLCVSVAYRPNLSELNIEPLTTLSPRIIMDYVGSDISDPLRYFPSTERGARPTYYPFRGIQSPSPVPIQRPHSWTSGFHRAPSFAHHQPVSGSPSPNRTSDMHHDLPSHPTDMFDYRVQNVRPPAHLKSSHNDEYQLSPPFSPSPSLSSPSHISRAMQIQMHSGSAPVSIPHPGMDKRSRYVTPNFSDPSRHPLPPQSPRSHKHEPLSQESPTGIRLYRKTEAVKPRELHSGIMNHYSSPKLARESKDDSGRFSGLLSSSGSPRRGFSRSSSRLSFQDDSDDCDFSCPFDVDDVDVSESQVSQKVDGRTTSEFNSQSLQLGMKSQDAAVGVLVHMLRTAPPLRQDSSCYSSHSLKTDLNNGGGAATASGFFMPRKTTDALEELRSYRQMKDLLLSKSRTQMLADNNFAKSEFLKEVG